MHELCGNWKSCAEKFINCLAKQLRRSLLTKFHASDMTDKIKRAHQGRVISFHTPFMFMKGMTLRKLGFRIRTPKNPPMKATMTHYTGHLSSDGSQNPEDTLKIEHLPKTCRILLVQHPSKHDAEERQVRKKVYEYIPTKRIRPRDETRPCRNAPCRMSLRRGCRRKILKSTSFAIGGYTKCLPLWYLNKRASS
jgi:hypothetical protein